MTGPDRWCALLHRSASRGSPDSDGSPARGGPLAGIRLVVKDNIAVAGLPTRAASPALADRPATADAPVVAALRRAGAVVVGTANMHELAIGVTSDNAATGRVDNPRRPGHLAGGSSGGTAAAIAAGLVAAGLGTDTGGSVRIPAAFCGVAGLRPTPGRYPAGGAVPLSATLDTVGPLAAGVADLIRLDAVLAGPAAAPPPAGWRAPAGPPAGVTGATGLAGVRLAVPRSYFFDDLDAVVADAVEAALDRLRDAGCELVECDLPGLARLVASTHEAVARTEMAAALTDVARRHLGGPLAALAERVASADVRAVVAGLAAGDVPSAASYAQALTVLRPGLQDAYADLFRRTGAAAVAVPCVPITAPPARTDPAATQSRELFALLTRNPLAASVAGLPSLCLPVGHLGGPGGPPVGLLLDGHPGADAELLRLGLAVETAGREPSDR